MDFLVVIRKKNICGSSFTREKMAMNTRLNASQSRQNIMTSTARPSCKDPARQLVGMLETIKRTAGPAMGIAKCHFPGFTGYVRALSLIYSEARRIQNDVSRFQKGERHGSRY